jgi:predicted SAM-dependent methyltransferase
MIMARYLDFSHTHISLRRSIWSYNKVQRLVSAIIRNRRVFMNLKTEGLYLDVGCGPNIITSNINLDYAWHPGVDVCSDITRGLPLDDSYVGGIYTEHCIEHIPFESALFVFREFHRVIRPGACIRIFVPDFEIYVDKYNQFRKTGEMSMPYASEDPIQGIYSPAMSVNRIFRAHGHQFIYDFATLSTMLIKVGFIEITKRSFGCGGDPNMIFDTPDRAIESLYVEARKVD